MGDTAALGIDLAATSLEDMAGATEKLDAQYNTLGAVAQGAFRKMQLALEPFGAVMLTVANAAMPMFEEGLANVEAVMAIAAGAVESFVANLQEGMAPLDAFIEAIWDIAPQSVLDALVNLRDNIIPALGLAFATYVQPVIDFVLEFVKMQDVMVAFAIVAGVVLIPIIWGILAPILAVIAVVALVVAAIALLRTAWEQNWGGIQEKTAAVIGFILPLVQGALASIQAWWAENGAAIMAAVSAHVEFVIGVFTNLFNFIMPLVQQGLAAISAWWTENGAAVMANVSVMWEFVSQGFTMAIDNLKLMLKAFFQFLTGDFEGAKNTVIALVSGWWDTVKVIFYTAVTIIQTAFSSVDWGAIGSSIVQGMADGIRNGAGWIVDAAKAALATSIVFQRRDQFRFAEIRPKGVGDVDLGVGNLPEQEVADAQLAAGAHQQVGIRNTGRVKVIADLLLVDVGNVDGTGPDFTCDAAHGVHQLCAATVTQRQHQREAGIVLQPLDALGELVLGGARHLVDAPDGSQADVVLVQFLDLGPQIEFQQMHQGGDFGPWPVPVLTGERVERQVLHAELAAGAHDGADAVRTAPVPFHARQAALLGPASVAVHDDGDVLRNLLGRGAAHRKMVSARRAPTLTMLSREPVSCASFCR
jgi:hypothetical protein